MKRYDQFEELKNLLFRMNSAEQDNLNSFLTAFDTNATKTFNKSAELVRLIFSKPEIQVNQAVNLLSLSKDKYNLNKFISRLKDKVLESISLDVNINRKGEYNDYTKARFEVDKKLLYSSILRLRGLDVSAEKVIEEAISKANKYELFDEVVRALKILQHQRGLKYGEKMFNKIENEIAEANHNYHCICVAQESHTKYCILIGGKKAYKKEQISRYIEVIIKKIEELPRSKHLQNINYYLLFFKSELLKINENYSENRKALHQLYKFIENNPAIHDDFRCGQILSDISENELNLNSFSKASESFEKALQYYSKESSEHFMISKNLIKTRVYEQQIDKALELCNSYITDSFKKEQVREKADIEYLKAICYAQQQKFEKSLEHIDQIFPLKELSDEAKFHICLIKIIAKAEIQKSNLDKETINDFNRTIRIMSSLKLTGRRDKVIARILKKLMNLNYNFKQTFSKNRNDFKQLKKNNSTLRWNPVSNEVLLFDEWFKSFAYEKPYQFK